MRLNLRLKNYARACVCFGQHSIQSNLLMISSHTHQVKRADANQMNGCCRAATYVPSVTTTSYGLNLWHSNGAIKQLVIPLFIDDKINKSKHRSNSNEFWNQVERNPANITFHSSFMVHRMSWCGKMNVKWNFLMSSSLKVVVFINWNCIACCGQQYLLEIQFLLIHNDFQCPIRYMSLKYLLRINGDWRLYLPNMQITVNQMNWCDTKWSNCTYNILGQSTNSLFCSSFYGQKCYYIPM